MDDSEQSRGRDKQIKHIKIASAPFLFISAFGDAFRHRDPLVDFTLHECRHFFGLHRLGLDHFGVEVLLHLGMSIALFTAALSWSTISRGRPAGPDSEYQVVTTSPGIAELDQRRQVGKFRQPSPTNGHRPELAGGICGPWSRASCCRP